MKVSAGLLILLTATCSAWAGGTPPPVATADGSPAEPATQVPTLPAAGGCCRIAAGTPVELEILSPIQSSRHKRGDRFDLRLSAPLMLDGATCVPAGTMGAGEVVHAMPGRGGGKPGELILAGRYLELAGQRIPLRGMRAVATGDASYGAALGVSFAVGPFAMFIRGNEIEIPTGTRATAKLAQELVLQTCSTPVVDPSVTTVPNQE
jgi:hypothetical protein